jgi:hypothetical protein
MMVWFDIKNNPPPDQVIDIWSVEHGRLTNYIYRRNYMDIPDNNFFDPFVSGPCRIRDTTHWMFPPKPPTERV